MVSVLCIQSYDLSEVQLMGDKYHLWGLLALVWLVDDGGGAAYQRG